MKSTHTFAVTAVALALGACATAIPVDNAALPESVRAPQGHQAKIWTVGAGEITYACRAKTDQSGAYAWAFVAPVATLYDAKQNAVGKYFGGPTWEANDGSKVTGKQMGVAPNGDGNIALQLVQAKPLSTDGTLAKVTFVQRLNTVGGAAPAAACDASMAGQERKVSYKADYVFYEAKTY